MKKTCLKSTFVALAGLVFPVALVAQALGSAALLRGVEADERLLAREARLQYFQNRSASLPWLEELEFRTETDRFEWPREEYLARLSVNGLSEIKRQRQLQASAQQLEAARWQTTRHRLLLERYETLLDYRLLLRRHTLLDALRQVYADQALVLKKLIELDNRNELDALLKSELDSDKTALDLAENDARQRQLRQFFQTALPDLPAGWALDLANFIQPWQLAPVLEGLPGAPGQHPESAEQQARIDRIFAEQNLLRARSAQVLDFVQVRYQNRPDEGFRRDFSVGLGFRLPYRGSDRVRKAGLEIERFSARQDLELYQQETARERATAQLRFAELYQRWQLARQQWTDSQARYTLAQGAAVSPLNLLLARSIELRRELILLDLEEALYRQYLKALDLSGALSAAPLINYFSPGLERL